MGLAAKLWDRVMDRLLEQHTGHVFLPASGKCLYCAALCTDVMEDFKKSRAGRCPNAPDPATVLKAIVDDKG